MRIKIIDLLNMISKGEELPKRIKYDDKITSTYSLNTFNENLFLKNFISKKKK